MGLTPMQLGMTIMAYDIALSDFGFDLGLGLSEFMTFANAEGFLRPHSMMETEGCGMGLAATINTT